MRVMVESERTLVVESPGNVMKKVFLAGILPLILLHAYIFYPQFAHMQRYGRHGLAWFLAALAVAIYVTLAYLALVALRDRLTTTFNGAKALVSIDRTFAFGIANREEIRFKDIEQFEISMPEDKGFCRMRLKDGAVRKLFQLHEGDDLTAIRRLDMITRQKVVHLT